MKFSLKGKLSSVALVPTVLFGIMLTGCDSDSDKLSSEEQKELDTVKKSFYSEYSKEYTGFITEEVHMYKQKDGERTYRGIKQGLIYTYDKDGNVLSVKRDKNDKHYYNVRGKEYYLNETTIMGPRGSTYTRYLLDKEVIVKQRDSEKQYAEMLNEYLKDPSTNFKFVLLDAYINRGSVKTKGEVKYAEEVNKLKDTVILKYIDDLNKKGNFDYTRYSKISDILLLATPVNDSKLNAILIANTKKYYKEDFAFLDSNINSLENFYKEYTKSLENGSSFDTSTVNIEETINKINLILNKLGNYGSGVVDDKQIKGYKEKIDSLIKKAEELNI